MKPRMVSALDPERVETGETSLAQGHELQFGRAAGVGHEGRGEA